MSTVADAFRVARTMLNDDVALNWTDDLLMPKMFLAHGEMVAKLVLNGLPVVREDTAVILIPAGIISMGVNQPVDLIKPIKMDERGAGESVSMAAPMTKVAFIPNYEKVASLRYWCFNQNIITFPGATMDRFVHLYYEGGITAPTKVSDILPILLSETFLGPRIVALCTGGKDQRGQNRDLFEVAKAMAEDNLSMIVRANVKGDQNLPVRRRPFSYSLKRRGGFGGGGVVQQNAAGGVAMYKFTVTGVINGTDGTDGNPTFLLDVLPSFLFLFVNGSFQTPGVNYTTSLLTITFQAPHIPITGSIIDAEGTR